MCESRANGQVLYLAGIVSTAYEFKESASEERALEVHCGEKDAYGQFTALTWYIDWIKERQTDMADGRNVERLSRNARNQIVVRSGMESSIASMVETNAHKWECSYMHKSV